MNEMKDRSERKLTSIGHKDAPDRPVFNTGAETSFCNFIHLQHVSMFDQCVSSTRGMHFYLFFHTDNTFTNNTNYTVRKFSN